MRLSSTNQLQIPRYAQEWKDPEPLPPRGMPEERAEWKVVRDWKIQEEENYYRERCDIYDWMDLSDHSGKS